MEIKIEDYLSPEEIKDICKYALYEKVRNDMRENSVVYGIMEEECRRMKEADKYYRPGKSELDWENPEDRIAMVKDCGFTCDLDAQSVNECAQCSAKEFCDEAIE